MQTKELTKLTGSADKKNAGSFVLENQELATAEGFRNVSRRWYNQTISFDDGLEALERGRAETEDFVGTLDQMTPGLNCKGQFAMVWGQRGEFYRPTEYCISQMGNWARAGRYYPLQLSENPTGAEGEQLYSRDQQDSETLIQVFKNGFRRLDQKKPFLWRVRKDGTLRAMLTDKYAMVDNRWFIETLKQLIPDGRLSHWRGDADTIYGNVLIPDTIRAETDSDYGGMLSIGNSEIGERKLSSMPSIFRSICQNGCIWGQQKGEGIRVVHRGKIDLDELYLEIKENLEQQIPLLPQGIVNLLGTRDKRWSGDVLPLFAQVANTFKLTKKQATSVFDAYNLEPGESNLFGVINAVTRAGQGYTNETWLAFDMIGGRLVNYSQDEWAKLCKRANLLSAKDVAAAFSSPV